MLISARNTEKGNFAAKIGVLYMEGTTFLSSLKYSLKCQIIVILAKARIH